MTDSSDVTDLVTQITEDTDAHQVNWGESDLEGYLYSADYDSDERVRIHVGENNRFAITSLIPGDGLRTSDDWYVTEFRLERAQLLLKTVSAEQTPSWAEEWIQKMLDTSVLDRYDNRKCKQEHYTDTSKGHRILSKIRRAFNDIGIEPDLRDQIQSFQGACGEAEYTDSGKMLNLLGKCRNTILPRVGRASQAFQDEE